MISERMARGLGQAKAEHQHAARSDDYITAPRRR
jgi:hypothetical protein